MAGVAGRPSKLTPALADDLVLLLAAGATSARAARAVGVSARSVRRWLRYPEVTVRVYADDFRRASERNAAVLARAAERGFGT
jgi:hypothetical protein